MGNQPSVNKCCYCCFLAWERGRERREKVIELGAPSVMMHDSFAENAKSFDAFVLTGFIKMSEKVTSSAEMLSLKILRVFFSEKNVSTLTRSQLIDAVVCLSRHTKHFNEWSLHANAYVDPTAGPAHRRPLPKPYEVR